MSAKKINYLLIIVIMLTIFTVPISAVGEVGFENCNLCREKIERLYKDGEIEVVEWALFKYYLSNDPFEIPDEARCDLHKGYIKSIDFLLDNKEMYLGEKINIKGTFEGWDGKYEPPPVTRSDWVIADSTGGIYVYGPFPANLNPSEKEDRGKKLFLSGILRKIKYDEKEMFYIERTKPDINTLIISDDKE